MVAYEIVSLVQVRGIPLQVRTVETGKDREECLREHGSSIAAAYPKAMGAKGLITHAVRREDLEAWARDKAKEALERARMDSRKLSLPINDAFDKIAREGLPSLGVTPDWAPATAEQMKADLAAMGGVEKLTCMGCFMDRVFGQVPKKAKQVYGPEHTCKKVSNG